MANLIGIACHILDKSYSLYQAVKMRRYSSLININPYVLEMRRKCRKGGSSSTINLISVCVFTLNRK